MEYCRAVDNLRVIYRAWSTAYEALTLTDAAAVAIYCDGSKFGLRDITVEIHHRTAGPSAGNSNEL